MPYVLSEDIRYNPTDTMEALDYIRQFALTIGWTVDNWDGYRLQLFSPGYSIQNLCYRLEVETIDAQVQTLEYRPVIPGQRLVNMELMTSTYIWNTSSSYGKVSLPASSFDALYLYGNSHFIAAIFHVDPIAVITVAIGIPDLWPSWYYSLDFSCHFPCSYYSDTSSYQWYNMADNISNWYMPWTYMVSYVYCAWFQGEAINSNNFTGNYLPTTAVAIGAEAGSFNKLNGLLRYNEYTNKRMAFQSTYFVKSETLGVWYPIGLSPFAWINGRDLSIGEVVEFGADQYRCFPAVFSPNEIWQAYRIS